MEAERRWNKKAILMLSNGIPAFQTGLRATVATDLAPKLFVLILQLYSPRFLVSLAVYQLSLPKNLRCLQRIQGASASPSADVLRSPPLYPDNRNNYVYYGNDDSGGSGNGNGTNGDDYDDYDNDDDDDDDDSGDDDNDDDDNDDDDNDDDDNDDDDNDDDDNDDDDNDDGSNNDDDDKDYDDEECNSNDDDGSNDDGSNDDGNNDNSNNNLYFYRIKLGQLAQKLLSVKVL